VEEPVEEDGDEDEEEEDEDEEEDMTNLSECRVSNAQERLKVSDVGASRSSDSTL